MGEHRSNRRVYEGLTFAEFRERRMVRDAVVRNFEVISEASRHIAADLKSRHGDIPWPRIAAIGNLLGHRYWETDPSSLWRIIQDDLGSLDSAIRSLIADWKD